MKKLPISLVCGFSAMLITILMYVLLLRNVFLQGICLITLFGVLLAEFLTTGLAYLSKGHPRRVASAIVSSFLIPYAVILSVVYIVNFPEGYGTYLGWYFVGLLIVGVISVILFAFNDKKAAENEVLQNAKENMLSLRKLVKCVMANPAADPYQKALYAIEEKLHFTNDSVIAPQDAVIESLLVDLLNQISNPETDVEAMLTNINQVIDTRTIMNNRNV